MRYVLWLVIIGLLFGASACDIEVLGGEFVTPTPAVTAGPTPTPLIFGRPGTQPTATPRPPTPTLTPTPTPIPGVEATPTKEPAIPEQMVTVPAGPFLMGSDSGEPDEQPPHEVDLPAFEIDRFEVTNADFAQFVEATGYQTDAEKEGLSRIWRDAAEGKDDHPVVYVSWNDAQAFCRWLGKRLPTEAEWEKAARGTDGRLYPWGNDYDPGKLNGKDSGIRGTAPVGSFPEGVSPYEIFDMAGNVWEWTADWYEPYPGCTFRSDYFGQKYRVLRGGGWFETAEWVRTTVRNANSETAANDDLGFRCAR